MSACVCGGKGAVLIVKGEGIVTLYTCVEVCILISATKFSLSERHSPAQPLPNLPYSPPPKHTHLPQGGM